MDSESLTLANKGLSERVNVLTAQLATQEKKLRLCFEFIINFSHYVPRMAEKFQIEYHKIEDEENVDVI